MTTIYFIRHAQPQHWEDDRTRPLTDERLRERESGAVDDYYGMIEKRWQDHGFHEDGGEPVRLVYLYPPDWLGSVIISGGLGGYLDGMRSVENENKYFV